MDPSTDEPTPTRDGSEKGGKEDRPRKHKRPRLVLSCTECVRRKTKCDRHVPCAACIKRGDASKCRVDEVDEVPSQPFALSGDHIALKKRVAFLEGLLRESHPEVVWPGPLLKTSFVPGRDPQESTAIVNETGYNSPRGDSGSSTSSPNNAAGAHSPGPSRSPSRHRGPGDPVVTFTYDPIAGPSMTPDERKRRSESMDSGTENAAMTLEMIALGKVKGRPDTMYRPVPSSAGPPLVTFQGPTSTPVPPATRSPLLVGEDRRREEDLAYLRSIVPSREMSRKLIDSYVNRVDFTYHTLHYPSFSIELEEFWQLLDSNRFGEVDPAWLAQYLMVACLGMLFLPPDPQVSQEQQTSLPSLWFAAAQRALQLADWTGKPQLRCVAAIVQFTLYLLNIGEVERLVVWVSSALRIAQILGLHQLNDSNDRIPNDPVAYASGPPLLKREMGKRLFWLLLYVEWHVADRSLDLRGIRPEDFTTSPPKNYEDDDLMLPNPMEQPRELPTRMSYEIFRIELIQEHQRWMIEQRTKPQTYESVMHMDRKLQERIAALPSFFHPDHVKDPEVRLLDQEKPYLPLQRCVVNVGLHNRIMRLHRPYLTRASKDKTFEMSAKRCVRSARMVLASIQVFRALSASCNRFWFVSFYTFSSALVLLVHNLASEIPAAEFQEHQREVMLAIASLRAQESSSVIARSGLKVLEGLLQEGLRHRANRNQTSPAAGRRGQSVRTRGSSATEGDYVHDVLHRMVLDAERSVQPRKGSSVGPALVANSPVVDAFSGSPPSHLTMMDAGPAMPAMPNNVLTPQTQVMSPASFVASDLMMNTGSVSAPFTFDDSSANDLLKSLGFLPPTESSSPTWPAAGPSTQGGFDSQAFANVGDDLDFAGLGWIDGLGGTV